MMKTTGQVILPKGSVKGHNTPGISESFTSFDSISCFYTIALYKTDVQFLNSDSIQTSVVKQGELTSNY